MKYYDRIYLDLEKDIVVDFYKDNDEYYYEIRTPNYPNGNLISNLAKVCNVKTTFDKNGLKIICGKVPSFINEENKRIRILKLNNKTIAVINDKGKIMRRAEIPAISKTFMSQTKEYDQSFDRTLIRTYIEEEYKFKTDVHTHMNACLNPDVLIALGIYHQIRYPYYYILKLDLKLTPNQKSQLLKQRRNVAKMFANSELVGKRKERRINDNTYINFADLILNNLKYAKYNIDKIRTSLTIIKDGQAVFTNLEKLYLYRYVFTKGVDSDKKIKLKYINQIPDDDVKYYLLQMLNDSNNSKYKNNTLLQDKLLWIARSYKIQGINYVEISNTSLVKKEEAINYLKQAHYILPLAEKETGVKLRFLAAIRRIPLTIIKDSITPENYLRQNLDVLKAVGYDPYVVGCDFVGEEINEIEELKPVIKEIVEYCNNNPTFTIRIHAGENDLLKDNVKNSIKCVKESLLKGQKMPILRIGHSLHTPSLKTKSGKQLLDEMKKNNVILEFQITSNVRLNNLLDIDDHPLKTYLDYGIKAVVGTDGCGIYGTNSLHEQLALINLLKIGKNEMKKITNCENFIVDVSNKGFIEKQKYLNNVLKKKSYEDYMNDKIKKNSINSISIKFNKYKKLLSEEVLTTSIKHLPDNMYPIVIAGGSFNSGKNNIKLQAFDKHVVDRLLSKLDPNKVFFLIGHKLNGYEKYLVDKNKRFKVISLVPVDISNNEKNRLLKSNLPLLISKEVFGMGLYKSFNYEIFERRPSTLIAFDGNSSITNLVQEAKNGKAKSHIFVSNNSKALVHKANALNGYVSIIKQAKDIDKLIKTINDDISTTSH